VEHEELKRLFPRVKFIFHHLRSFRFTVEDEGTLAIADVSAVDEGAYECLAKNEAGIRTSRAASLSIQGEKKSFFLSRLCEYDRYYSHLIPHSS